MTEKRFVRKGYKIWDTWEDEEVYELHYRYECRDICRILNNWSEENEQLKSTVEELEFKLRTIEAYDRTVKEEHSDTVYDFKKKLETW